MRACRAAIRAIPCVTSLPSEAAQGVPGSRPQRCTRSCATTTRAWPSRRRRNGDYRRAAFIYARLLNDYRRAAAALAKGGLHHDAAVLYLKKLGDSLTAAREFEAAGEIDRALELYRQRGEHELAGDLLRRAGEEEQAIAEYVIAAANLVEAGQHYQAGELLRQRAQREDLALPYYGAGWKKRPSEDALSCATRLAQRHAAQQAEVTRLLDLLSNAEEFLPVHAAELAAVEFFNEIARLAAAPLPARVHAELRDRALLGIAAKLRGLVEQGTSPAAVGSRWLAQGGIWPAGVISDADYALKAAKRARGGAEVRSPLY